MTEILTIAIVSILIGFCIGRFAASRMSAPVPHWRKNAEFNQRIIDAKYAVGQAELNYIRTQLERISSQRFQELMDDFEVRSQQREKLFKRIENLRRKETNPFTDSELTFLTVPQTDDWAEVIE